jgi:hypothetical protein
MNVQLISIALAAMSIFLAMAEQELSWKKWFVMPLSHTVSVQSLINILHRWDALPGDDVIQSFPNECVMRPPHGSFHHLTQVRP